MKNKPLVAIQCFVYNHEPYLHDCLDGFVMQQTDFPFVAIVHDDASTDNSANIIRDYAEKYPNIIYPIFEAENQFSKHDGTLGRIMNNAIAATGAKYIAFCEGDDYWTDANKLQRQVDFLETNSEYSAIGENGLELNSILNSQYPFNLDSSHDISMKEAIIKRRFPTAGVLCRKKALEGFDDICKFNIDTICWCWLISKGKFRYDNAISSVYRRGLQGVTESTESYQWAKITESWNLEILRVFEIDKSFMYAHIAKSCFNITKGAIRKLSFISICKCSIMALKYTFLCLNAKIHTSIEHSEYD